MKKNINVIFNGETVNGEKLTTNITDFIRLDEYFVNNECFRKEIYLVDKDENHIESFTSEEYVDGKIIGIDYNYGITCVDLNSLI